MRITFVLPSFSRGPAGGVRVVYELASRLTAMGHVATAVHGGLGERLSPGLLRRDAAGWAMRVALKGCPVDPAVRLRYSEALRPAEIPDADAVLATAWNTARPVWDLPPEKGRKFYLVQQYETWFGTESKVGATWRLPMRKIVIAPWLLRKGRELGCPPEEMTLIRYGVDHSVFRPLRPVEARPPRVAMLYSKLRHKGGEDGILALELARKAFPRLRAALFGVSFRPAGLPGWMEYFRQPEREALASEVYGSSGVYLCPSWSEGCHMPPMEAMACGCALVSTDIEGVRLYAEHGRTALLSGPRRPRDMAENLLRVLQDEPLRTRLARAGRERMRRFSWEKSARSLLERVRSAPSGRPSLTRMES